MGNLWDYFGGDCVRCRVMGKDDPGGGETSSVEAISRQRRQNFPRVVARTRLLPSVAMGRSVSSTVGAVASSSTLTLSYLDLRR